jgi:hypothetical protein
MTHIIAFAAGYLLARRKWRRSALAWREAAETNTKHALTWRETALKVEALAKEAIESAQQYGLMWRHAASTRGERAEELRQPGARPPFGDGDDTDPITKH